MATTTIDTKSLTDLITEFRKITAKDAITPENLGYILQRIAGFLSATLKTSIIHQKSLPLRMKKLLPFIIAILSATAHAAEHHDSITVSGKVFDEADNTPLSTCCVGIKGESNKWEKMVMTDSIGAFSLKIPANSTLWFEYIGMEPEKVELGDTDECNLEIKLHESCNVLIDWVTLPTIELFVYDKDGIPVKNALVAIINPQTDELIAELGTTDACGYFYWFNNNIEKGKYVLLVESEYREPKTAKINLNKKHSVINIQLSDPIDL